MTYFRKLILTRGKKSCKIIRVADGYAQIAQLVEQRTENPRVAGSIPALGIVLFKALSKCFPKFLAGVVQW